MAKFDPSLQSMLEVFLYETTTLLDQLEELLMTTEKEESIGSDEINQIFRIMHTIKGSSAMMGFDNLSVLAHKAEDMFFVELSVALAVTVSFSALTVCSSAEFARL